MPSYLIGVLTAFTEPVFHGWANILDRYFSGEVFERRIVLLALSAVFGLCVIPIVWIFSPPEPLTLPLFCAVFAAAFLEILYHFPYYQALQEADTSIIAALFNLGKVILPIAAYFFFGEHLNDLQYAGFFIVIFASVFLTADLRQLRINRAFFLMLLSSLLVSAQTLVIKYAYTLGMTWGSLVIWMTVFEVAVVAAFMFNRLNRQAFGTTFSAMRGNWGLYIQLETVGWIGNTGSAIALYFIPVTVAKAIASSQALFPLMYAGLFGKRLPDMFREYMGRDGVIKKTLLFVCMILGVVLTIAG